MLRPRGAVFLAVSFRECLPQIYFGEHASGATRRVMALDRCCIEDSGGYSRSAEQCVGIRARRPESLGP